MAEHSVGQGTLMNGGYASFTQTFNNNHYVTPSQRELLQALKFPTSGLREQMVERQSHGTCEWFLRTTEYRNWIGSGNREGGRHRMLWILGKAGSGKSTLLKFIIGQVHAHAADSDLLFTHFFNARGGVLERSVEGMYRTVLVQILDKLEHLSDALLEETRGWMPSKGASWPVPTLITLLKAAIRMLKGRELVFFIDALDECDNEEAQEMVEGFESLIEEAGLNGQKFRVCFASRPYPHIATDCAEFFRLDRSESHKDDMREYIEAHLRIGQSTAQPAVARREEIKQQLLVKSEHVFLWTKLVVNLLNREYRFGRPERYNRWLKGSLGDLDKLYMEIWQQDDGLDAEQDRRAQILCFQWVLYHIDQDHVPTLKPRDLWWGIQLGLGQDVDDIHRMSSELDDASIQRFITSTSKGLVETYEIIASDESSSSHSDSEGSHAEGSHAEDSLLENHPPQQFRASFIHESAREFILSDGGPLKQLCGLKDSADLELHGHLQLKDCCDSLLEYCRLHESNESHFSWKILMTFIAKIPIHYVPEKLLYYACSCILRHANTVQQLQMGNHNQSEWMANFYTRYEPWPEIIFVDGVNVLKPSLFTFLVVNESSALMQAGWQLLFNEARDARHCRRVPGVSDDSGNPFVMRNILENVNVDAIRVIVEIYLRLEVRHHLIQNLLLSLASQGFANNWTRVRNNVPDNSPRKTSWLFVANYSDDLATLLLIALIPSTVNFSDDEARALQREAGEGCISALNHLLRQNTPSRVLSRYALEWEFKAGEGGVAQEPELELEATLAALRAGEITYEGFVAEQPN